MHGDTTIQSNGIGHVERTLRRRFLIILYREQESRVLELADGEEIVVGRGEEASLCIDDNKISRRHTRLWRDGNRIFVEDLGSTNGTRINGVTVQGSHRLGPGDEVGVGAATLVVSSLALTVGPYRVLTDGELEERLEAETDRARRFRRLLSLIMLRMDGKAENLRSQLSAMASVLRQMDVLGSYGPREYAVLLPEADTGAAKGVADRLSEVVARQGPGKVALGAATLPADAQSADMLIEVARERLRSARADRQTSPPPRQSSERVIVSVSRGMIQALSLARRVAGVSTTVLILGETGSGKQIIAEEIHRSSSRAKAPFVHVNCGAIPPSLVESELFGHERGAFTGAETRRAGYLEAASSGTLFLDEIGELPEAAQPKFLHFLESQSFCRVGGVRPIRADVRIIAATNRDLEAESKGGRFREDLYFRLSPFVLHVPPLRERAEDILPLASLFCAEFAQAMGQAIPMLSAGAEEVLKQHHWPGNVRQLRNAMERAVVLAENGIINEAHLPERVVTEPEQLASTPGPLEQKLSSLEQQSIESMLRQCGGNQSEAARRLGITRRSLIYRMKKLGLH